MRNKLKTLALGAAFAIGASGAAFAQACPAGYYWSAGACYPGGPALTRQTIRCRAPRRGESGAQQGAATAGPVGAIVGGALGTAGGALAGTGEHGDRGRLSLRFMAVAYPPAASRTRSCPPG